MRLICQFRRLKAAFAFSTLMSLVVFCFTVVPATAEGLGPAPGNEGGAASSLGPATGQVSMDQGEEALLSQALKELKAGNLDQAVDHLSRLKDSYPDNDDYLLLYRTALRKKNSSDADSQRWWNYERSLEGKANTTKSPALQSDAAQAPLKVPASPRVNQLKKATWVMLTTGKHKSPNNGRWTKLNPFNKDQAE